MVGTLIGLSQLWVCTKPVFATVPGVCISYSHCLGVYNTVFVTVWVCTTQCLLLSGCVQHQCLLLLCYTTSTFVTAQGVYNTVFVTAMLYNINIYHSSGCVQHSVCHCLGVYNTVFVTAMLYNINICHSSRCVQHSVCYCYVIQHQHLSLLWLCTTQCLSLFGCVQHQCLLLLYYTPLTFVTALGV